MDINQYLQLGIAFIFVLALMGGLSLLLKKLNAMQSGMGNKNNRLQIVEQRMIDTKHKAAIIRCDGTDHLVIIGQNGHSIVKTDIKPPKTPPSKKDIPVESF